MWDAVQAEDPLTISRRRWFPSQRGVGAYVLFAQCNSAIGRRFIAGYVDAARGTSRNLMALAATRNALPRYPNST